MISAVECLLHHGADAAIHNTYGTTALHFAARYGHEELCKLLLDTKGSELVNATDYAKVISLFGKLTSAYFCGTVTND